jgi:hypothetical protein
VLAQLQGKAPPDVPQQLRARNGGRTAGRERIFSTLTTTEGHFLTGSELVVGSATQDADGGRSAVRQRWNGWVRRDSIRDAERRLGFAKRLFHRRPTKQRTNNCRERGAGPPPALWHVRLKASLDRKIRFIVPQEH